VYTAPHFGFRDAEDYYYRCSAMRIADRIQVPALVITAEDDPFVPSDPFRSDALSRNRHVELHITRHGGHCGFVSSPSASDDGYWAETQIVNFAEQRYRGRAEPLAVQAVDRSGGLEFGVA
jgi:predicted alpha/beta-fold hydrolase